MRHSELPPVLDVIVVDGCEIEIRYRTFREAPAFRHGDYVTVVTMKVILLTWLALSVPAALFVWAILSVGARGDDDTWN